MTDVSETREELLATYNDLLALQDQTDHVPLTTALDAVGAALAALRSSAQPMTKTNGVREALALAREYISDDHGGFEEGSPIWVQTGEILQKIQAALRAQPRTEEVRAPTDAQHGRNCPALGSFSDFGCTCGLRYRIELQTEREMHSAWRKRAEEAEARFAAMRDALQKAQKIIEREFPNGQTAIDIRDALAAVPPERGEK